MKTLPTVDDFAGLFRRRVPLLDVRAPVEFARGAFPGAVNLPLLDDAQREIIGKTYKDEGQDAAVALGHHLATPAVREARRLAWRAFLERHPDAVLYCFRGGLRSQISQQWLSEDGWRIPRVAGGYKALRQFLIQTLESFCERLSQIVLSGQTGSGKTDVLCQMDRYIDLEGAANHRGSAFGHTVLQQPTPIDFENRLAVAMLSLLDGDDSRPVFIEDESHLIGRLAVPPVLLAKMKDAPIVVLETPIDERVERIVRDYITRQRHAFETTYGSLAAERFHHFVLANLDRIRRRLGGALHAAIRAEWEHALDQLERTGDATGFRPGVEVLLVQYYDPMYAHQQLRLQRNVLFQGDATAILHQFSQT
ncbi:MAG: tRNA 2-selenouridine(34) synthase MnmH [Hahellaceae bacterium]|jgi:tRNA 2-selenouridine synthase|nr:tRNA 2-selenouridine(34) synthase MnmH [Hahellaceae bacterium]